MKKKQRKQTQDPAITRLAQLAKHEADRQLSRIARHRIAEALSCAVLSAHRALENSTSLSPALRKRVERTYRDLERLAMDVWTAKEQG